MKNTKIVELVIEDDNQELAIDAISLVTAPAIEQDFVFFGKEKNNLTFAKVDEEKRMLVSPALIPNKHIFRYDPNTDSDYYVYFSKETVRRASELYLKHNNHHKATYQHQDRVSGVLTVESWIKEGDMDKSKMYGFDLPNGTWFVKMRIDNDDLWNKIKEGELKGLSIEGFFTNKFEQMQEKKPTDLEILSALNEIIRESQKPKKVELATIDELKKHLSLVNELVKNGSKITAETKSIVAGIRNMANFKKESVTAKNKAETFLDEFADAAKELGIKPMSVKEYAALDNSWDKLSKVDKEVEDSLKSIKQAL